MYTQNDSSILLRVLITAAFLVPGVCRAEDFLVTGFRVTYTAELKDGVGRITAAARWKKPAIAVQYYNLYTEGRLIARSSQGRTSATGLVYYYPHTQEEFEIVTESYFSTPHTFTLEAVLYSGEKKCDSYTYIPADILRIQNHVAGFSDMQNRVLQVFHDQDANEGPDVYDAAHHVMHLPASAAVASVRTDPHSGVQARLASDARPKESTSEIYLDLSLESETGAPIPFAKATENQLRLSIPRSGYDFRPHPMTLQQYDPAHPSARYPVYDVRRVVSGNEGVVWLPPLKGSYESGVPYAHFKLSFTKSASGDVSGDGVFNLRDFAVLAGDWRTVGIPTIADIAGPRGLGVPDGVVNGMDLRTFCRKWAGEVDNFESGGLDELGWMGEGNAYWTVTSSECRSGLRCAQAGRIEDNQRSRLMITIDCRAGEVSFWRKVSSEARYDFLRFRSGGTVLGEWSGELDWERVSFTVQAGRRTFSWDYVKDSGGVRGRDTAWIDLVSFPTSDLGRDGK